MLDARALTAKQKGNPDSWADVKQRLPLLSQKPWYSKTTYGYARGHEAYAYVENIRKYQISLMGYLQEKEKQAAKAQAEAKAKSQAEAEQSTMPASLAATPLSSFIPLYGQLPLTPFFRGDAGEKNRSVEQSILVQAPLQ
jgi:membrane-bound lytic murein transglycosylase F